MPLIFIRHPARFGTPKPLPPPRCYKTVECVARRSRQNFQEETWNRPDAAEMEQKSRSAGGAEMQPGVVGQHNGREIERLPRGLEGGKCGPLKRRKL